LLLFYWEPVMLTTMRKVGNSRGVLIPAAFLASCQIEDQVDMQLQDGQIVIKPVQRKLRDGWFGLPASESAMAQEAAHEHDWSAVSVADDSEWVW
jgi:antitoxin MazE